MLYYILRRLTLLPLTLFAIITVNFVILNLAPIEPAFQSQGEELKSQETTSSGLEEDPYSLFYRKYGLNLPILFNTWIFDSPKEVAQSIHHWYDRFGKDPILRHSSQSIKELRRLKSKATYQIPQLLNLISSKTPRLTYQLSFEELQLISGLMVQGAKRSAHTGIFISAAQRVENEEIAGEHLLLDSLSLDQEDELPLLASKWHLHLIKRPDLMRYSHAHFWKKLSYMLIETRFVRYLGRLMALDFGTLRSDPHRLVTQEVLSRLPTSLTLAFAPMCLTLFLALFFGCIMARFHKTPLDIGLNLLFLTLYAIPVFVVGPWLIEHFAGKFPSWAPLPSGGFHSEIRHYQSLNSTQRMFDVLHHICLPFIAVVYGTWASNARLTRSVVLDVMRQDSVVAAATRGLSSFTIWKDYIIRPSAIPLITALAGSLNVVLGGSLIVETLFEIDGFGKLFYEATLSRDINVMMFSTLMGAILTLTGYLIADLTYALLDPRIKLED